MVHLIKIHDYVSRYENDIHRYPNQFTRLKREKWEKMKKNWQQANAGGNVEEDWFEDTSPKFFRQPFQRLKKSNKEKKSGRVVTEEPDQVYANKTIEQLKKMFHYDVFQTQLNWASSSLFGESYLESKYRFDTRLRQLIQDIPDNFLLLYHPVLRVQRAEVQLDVILLSPTEVYVVNFLEMENNAVVRASNERFWPVVGKYAKAQLLNPMIAQERSFSIIRSILQKEEIHPNISTLLIAPDGILMIIMHVRTKKVDRANYSRWLSTLQAHRSPLKKQQIDVARALLKYSKTSHMPYSKPSAEDDDK
ncbi:LOW QUALITY PROTEIN: hypothetical protein JCM19039_2794 [Geomicrobium sp. JCM 19039]|nr:LOW QUALITY PROTEIN: hypothetical protein JCM19039_2794 [Geomicrobium sp. JCM 19039]